MSKVSSNYPAYSSSALSVGDSKATTGVTDGILTSNYKMSDSESAIYNYALSTIASILPGINTFDTNTLSGIQSEVDAYKSSGIEDINELYNSSLTNLEGEVASRFGNLDNSIFADKLDDIESERADSVSSFAQDVLSKQSKLESDELTQRYALINLLSGLADNTYSNALSAINTALTGSSKATDYNAELYKALSNMSSAGSNNTSSLISSLLGSGNSSKAALLSSLLGSL